MAAVVETDPDVGDRLARWRMTADELLRNHDPTTPAILRRASPYLVWPFLLVDLSWHHMQVQAQVAAVKRVRDFLPDKHEAPLEVKTRLLSELRRAYLLLPPAGSPISAQDALPVHRITAAAQRSPSSALGKALQSLAADPLEVIQKEIEQATTGTWSIQSALDAPETRDVLGRITTPRALRALVIAADGAMDFSLLQEIIAPKLFMALLQRAHVIRRVRTPSTFPIQASAAQLNPAVLTTNHAPVEHFSTSPPAEQLVWALTVDEDELLMHDDDDEDEADVNLLTADESVLVAALAGQSVQCRPGAPDASITPAARRTLRSRLTAARILRVCANCAKPGHMARECKAPRVPAATLLDAARKAKLTRQSSAPPTSAARSSAGGSTTISKKW